LFLIILIAITASAALVARSVGGRRARRIEDMARGWGLRFSQGDRFQLSMHVVSLLPIPGAADVVVRDIAYCQESGCYRYLFTVEYTAGVLRTKHRCCSAGVLIESRTCPTAQAYSPVTLASAELSIDEQYAELHRRFFPGKTGAEPDQPLRDKTPIGG